MELIREVTRVIVTAAALIIGTALVWSGDEKAVGIGGGFIGVVIGYWFK